MEGPLSPGFQEKRKASCSRGATPSPALVPVAPEPGVEASLPPPSLSPPPPSLSPPRGAVPSQGPLLTYGMSSVLLAFLRPLSGSAPPCAVLLVPRSVVQMRTSCLCSDHASFVWRQRWGM